MRKAQMVRHRWRVAILDCRGFPYGYELEGIVGTFHSRKYVQVMSGDVFSFQQESILLLSCISPYALALSPMHLCTNLCTGLVSCPAASSAAELPIPTEMTIMMSSTVKAY